LSQDLSVWFAGVGRIRREPWVLHVGGLSVDVDELRSHDMHKKLEPLIRALSPPPTAAEALWLARIFSYGTPKEFQAGTDMLMDVVNKSPETLDARST
jgi:hypothetical protein